MGVKVLTAYRAHRAEQAAKGIARANEHTTRDAATRERLGWSDEAIEREIARQNKLIADAEAMTEVHQHPAYLSVGIFLYTRPTEQQIDFMKDRTHRFVQYCRDTKFLPDDLVIEGFRLVEQVMTEITTKL